MMSHPPDQVQRVLVVDDEAALLGALSVALKGENRDVTACRSFEAAREKLLAEDFDVLMTDIRLGAFNGLQLAVIARQKAPDMRIVVFSGFDDPVLRSEAASLGACYLTKPLTAELLLRAIEAPL